MRCEARGIEREFVETLDVERTKAVRSIGNGSQVNRVSSLRELLGMMPQFDETGRKNLTRDIVATRVGHDLADRYIPQMEGARPTVDNKIAFLENKELMDGQPVPVVSNELHGSHLQIHVPELNQLIEQLNMGVADPVQALPALQAFYQHISDTAQQIASDPAMEGLLGQTKQVLQFAEEMINNTSKQVQKMQRDAMQGQGQEGQEGQEGGSEMASKMQEHQLKMQMAQQKAELDMQIKQAKFEQEQAIRDAENVMKLREKL